MVARSSRPVAQVAETAHRRRYDCDMLQSRYGRRGTLGTLLHAGEKGDHAKRKREGKGEHRGKRILNQ